MGALSGISPDANTAAVTGNNTATAAGGRGVLGTSTSGEGVHGETDSPTLAAVGGIAKHNDAGVFGVSQDGSKIAKHLRMQGIMDARYEREPLGPGAAEMALMGTLEWCIIEITLKEEPM